MPNSPVPHRAPTPQPEIRQLAAMLHDLLFQSARPYDYNPASMTGFVYDMTIKGAYDFTKFAERLAAKRPVFPSAYLGPEQLRELPFGTLVQRDDGQVWQRVDALLASWARVWPNEDDGRARPVFPARVIWQPEGDAEAVTDEHLCLGCGNDKRAGLHGMSEYGGCV